MTPAQAAKVIGCHKRYVRTLIARGKLRATYYELPSGMGCYDIPRKEVERYAETKQSGGFPRGKKRN